MMMMEDNGDTAESRRNQLKEYAERYRGRTKVRRMLFLADHGIGEEYGADGGLELQLGALKIAYDEVIKLEDVNLFEQVLLRIDGRLGPDYKLPFDWYDSLRQRSERLMPYFVGEETLCEMYPNRERSRNLWKSRGDYHYGCGELREAHACYSRLVDLDLPLEELVQVYMPYLLVCIELGEFADVFAAVGELDDAGIDVVTSSRLCCESGLAFLHINNYNLAAEKFLRVSHEMDGSYGDLISSEDVATYGGLLALVSFPRAELKSKVFDNESFSYYLGFAPRMKEIIVDFYSRRFASSLEKLNTIKPKLLLDMFLHRHVEAAYVEIRNKALMEYSLQHSTLSLDGMSEYFAISVPVLVNELRKLIDNGQLQARIDIEKRLLCGQRAEQQKETCERVLHMVNQLEIDAKTLQTRIDLPKNDVAKLNDLTRPGFDSLN